jgi:hypothetical protein
MKEHGLRRGARSGNGSPLTGRKIAKLPRCPRATVSAQSNHLKSDSTNDVTRIRVIGKLEYDKWWTPIGENSAKYGMTYLRIDDDKGSRQKTNMKDIEESRKTNSFFESIPENIRL